jgi:arsenate reductase
MYPQLLQTIKGLDKSSISVERKKQLGNLAELLSKELITDDTVNLNFICTHNSRRSHLAQVWSHTLSHYYNLNVESFSGGTESTAVYFMVINTLKNQGFEIGELQRETNPLYYLKSGENTQPLLLFSKTYHHSFNPESDYIAIMTCSQADENCPFVIGAKKRFALTFEDPKAFDHTDLKEQKYLERSLEIATQLNFVFKCISNQ